MWEGPSLDHIEAGSWKQIHIFYAFRDLQNLHTCGSRQYQNVNRSVVTRFHVPEASLTKLTQKLENKLGSQKKAVQSYFKLGVRRDCGCCHQGAARGAAREKRAPRGPPRRAGRPARTPFPASKRGRSTSLGSPASRRQEEFFKRARFPGLVRWCLLTLAGRSFCVRSPKRTYR